MSLDTKVDGDPVSIRETAKWLNKISGLLGESARLTHQAGAGSEGDWEGRSAESFREVIGRVKPRIAVLADGHDKVKGKLDTYADGLSSVQENMKRARRIAREGGLTVTGYEIQAPTEPASPKPLGDKPTQAERKRHQEAKKAVAAYDEQAEAYKEAAEIVRQARKQEDEAIEILRRGLKLNSNEWFALGSGLTTGLVGAGFKAYSAKAVNKSSELNNAAKQFERQAATARAEAEKLRNQRISKLNIDDQVLKDMRLAGLEGSADSYTGDAEHSRVKSGVYETVGGKLLKAGKVVSGAGYVLDVVGAVDDVRSGRESVAQAATSTGGSIVAGSLTGAAIGSVIPGPGTLIGAGVGAFVAWGTNKVIDDNWDDLAASASTNNKYSGEMGKAIEKMARKGTVTGGR